MTTINPRTCCWFLIMLISFPLSVNAATQYLAVPTIIPQVKVGVVPKGKPLATYTLTPSLAIELQEALDPATSSEMAVAKTAPFIVGRVLYGDESRPGLYCDLMRRQGLGLTASCLRDTNRDGKFDQAMRYDFNSGHSDMVFITDKGKVSGGKLKATISLRQPVAYRIVSTTRMPSAVVKLIWNAIESKQPNGTKAVKIELNIADASKAANSYVLSENYVQASLRESPVEIPFYGLKLTLIRLMSDGGLSYAAVKMSETATIGLVFSGFVIRFVTY